MEPATLQTLGTRWCAGEPIARLAREVDVPWGQLRSMMKKAGFAGDPARQARLSAAARKGLITWRATAGTPDPIHLTAAIEITAPAAPPATELEGVPEFDRSDVTGPTASLVAKYRPRCLGEVLGQKDVVSSLRAFVANPYPTAMLFHGDSGCGKTSAGYALAHELGVAVDETELGGLYEVASGSQSTDAVRDLLRLLRYRPLMGSGWRVCMVNECDRMALPAETIWLDALEHLPPSTVIIFTTNSLHRLSRRFRDRCETYGFQSATDDLSPHIRALARRIWQREGGQGDPPGLDRLGMPTLEDPDSMHCSFRLALQQLQRHVRERS